MKGIKNTTLCYWTMARRIFILPDNQPLAVLRISISVQYTSV